MYLYRLGVQALYIYIRIIHDPTILANIIEYYVGVILSVYQRLKRGSTRIVETSEKFV